MANKSKKELKPQPKKVFTSEIPIMFVHRDSLLVEGHVVAEVPTHHERIQINKKKAQLEKEKDDMKVAEYFYTLTEGYLRGVDVKVYQLPEDYSGEPEDYADQKIPLELVKHVTNHEELGFYEFSSFLFNHCLQTFATGVSLGKLRKKS